MLHYQHFPQMTVLVSLPTETDTRFIRKKPRSCHVCCPQNAAESPRDISQPHVRTGLEVGLSVFRKTISPLFTVL